MEYIASDQNPLLKQARRLSRSASERRRSGKTLLDGIHLIEAYATSFGLGEAVILVDEATKQVPEIRALTAHYAPLRTVLVREPLFRAASPVDNPSGVAAIVDIRKLTPASAPNPVWLLLDGVQDPGNLGSILRTAAAMSVNRALLSRTCADAWSPRSLRGGMGAQFTLPCEHADLEHMLERFPGRCIATAPRIGDPLPDADLSGSIALMFGGEGSGLSETLLSRADAVVHVPLAAGVESLNVGAAVAMCCYERLRQTRAAE